MSLSPIHGDGKINVEAFVVKDISNIANEHVEQIKQNYSHLKGVFFSDVCRYQDTLEVDVLVGADYIWEFQNGETIRGGQHEPIAVKTTLGWVLSGPLKGERLYSSLNCSHVVVNHVIDSKLANNPKQELDRAVHKLWDLDSLGIRVENEIHEGIIDDILFTGDRYSVGLPWKVGHAPLPTNYPNSLNRLKSQLKKLRLHPDLLEMYNNVILDQVQRGVIEQVALMEQAEQIHYIPHQAVCRENAETTKLRVVYDASCKDRNSGVSLNDCLHVGPPMTPLIFDILLRFRTNKVALVGDIEKAFHNIEVHPTDRDCLRFLWIDDIHKTDPQIVVYKFQRVPFGLNSSPFLLNAVLRHHIEKYKERDPEFVVKMKEGFFVDDLVTGGTSTEEAFGLYEKAKGRMMEGGFTLRKWKTNDDRLASMIAENENGKNLGEQLPIEDTTYAKETLNPSKEKESMTKVLGIPWDTRLDTFILELERICQASIARPTKRSILSTLATLIDPQGLVSPIAVSGKVLFQELCLEKFDWDDPLPDDKVDFWETWLRDLREVKIISIPRCVFEGMKGEIITTSLHGFADASRKCYCAMVYLVCETSLGVYTSLLCAKTRVAPLKSLTIPRLELMSAKVLATLMSTVVNALGSHLMIDFVRFWLDSKTALFWIANNGEWKNFVRHHVNEILKLTKKEEWGHVPGVENPADIGSRGAKASELRDSKLWWEGPKWLREEKETWPNNEPLEDLSEVSEERKKAIVLTTSVAEKESESVSKVIDINRFSKLGKLLRVTSYVKRFIDNLKKKRAGIDMTLEKVSVEELKGAEKDWIKDVQTTLHGKSDFEKSKVQLGIVMHNGVMICTGRLEHSDLGEETKRPIILPRDHRFTKLMILDCHERVHHCKVKGTLAQLRSRFWVTKGRQVVKKVINGCFLCRKLEGKPYSLPPTAPLPDFRVTQALPFSNIGVDFAGPLYVKGARGQMNKVYITLFTCCVTRAVHLELIENLQTPTFVNCLRRFASRRGTPALVVSDNAKTFKATARLLQKLQKDEQFQDFLASRRTEWKFNMERAPWMGGVFERMIGSVKRCLRKVLGNAKLTFDELNTVLIEIEGTLNSRPLTYLYDKLEEALTPSHLLFGHRLSPLSENVDIHANLDNVDNDKIHKRFLYLTRKLNHFWNRWRKEYVTDLRESHKLTGTVPAQIASGDVVLIYDANEKRGFWKTGIVQDIIVGKDGVVRG